MILSSLNIFGLLQRLSTKTLQSFLIIIKVRTRHGKGGRVLSCDLTRSSVLSLWNLKQMVKISVRYSCICGGGTTRRQLFAIYRSPEVRTRKESKSPALVMGVAGEPLGRSGREPLDPELSSVGVAVRRR